MTGGDSQGDAEPLRTVELPDPRPASIEAIEAARAYVLDHGRSTKAEIANALVPEENYPIGHNGPAAKAKGFAPGFRDWWWREAVVPGLRALPDVEADSEEEVTWTPARGSET